MNVDLFMRLALINSGANYFEVFETLQLLENINSNALKYLIDLDIDDPAMQMELRILDGVPPVCQETYLIQKYGVKIEEKNN